MTLSGQRRQGPAERHADTAVLTLGRGRSCGNALQYQV